MEYKPYSFNMGTVNIVSEELLVGSTVDGQALNTTSIRQAVDFHCQKASRNYRKYVGVAKSRFRNGSALVSAIGSGSGNARWLDIVSGSPYSEGKTFFVAQNDGITAPAPNGIMYVTYYVWFKTQRIDT